MRQRLATYATIAVATLVTLGISAPQAEARQTIYVRNVSSLSNAKVIDAIPAFQAAVSKDFAPIWNADAKLIFIGKAQAPKGAWEIDLTDYPACFNCYGFHEYANGVIRGEVGTAQGNWQITFTHELFEILGDPWADLTGGARGVLVGSAWYALETADPVEANAYTYTRKGRRGQPVRISDFITPEWFVSGSDGPWDFTHAVRFPLQILPGGYQLVYRNGAWESLGQREHD